MTMPSNINAPKIFLSKYHNVRKETVELIKDIVKPGDVLFRLGNAKVFDILPFSWIIAGLTKSQYSHASIISDIKDGVFLVIDIDIYGIREQRFIDWLDDCVGPFLGIYRVKQQYENKITQVINLCKKWLENDVGYNFNFADVSQEEQPKSLYCTQLVYEAFRRAANLSLSKSKVKFRDLIQENETFFKKVLDSPIMKKFIQENFYLNLDTLEIIVVGNDDYGLMACEEFEPVVTLMSDGNKVNIISKNK